MKKGLLFQNREKRIPTWIVLQLLEACNLRCKMCYEWGETGAYKEKKELHRLDFNRVKEIIDQCEPAHPYYELFGGEPLMYPNIFEVIEYIHQHGSKVDIATNGTLLEQYAQEVINSNITRIWVSIDGNEKVNDEQRGEDCYKKATAGIRKILELRKENRPQIGITTIVTPKNADNLSMFFDSFTKNYKIDHASFEFQNYATEDRYLQYKEFLKENFQVTNTISGRGLIRDIKDFEKINFEFLEKEMLRVKQICEEREIKFFHNPNTIAAKNYKNYFTAEWDKMDDYKKRCPFVWIHAEIAASGEVIICHTLQDLSFGNINQTRFLDIWNNEKSQKFRNLMRRNMMPMCIACSRYYTQIEGHKE